MEPQNDGFNFQALNKPKPSPVFWAFLCGNFMTNTTKQPFLAKPSGELSDNSVIHIIHDEQDRLEAICDYGYDDLIPLTAEEVWELMPWQGMETAPKDGTKVMILFSGGLVIGCYRKNAWRDGSYIIFPKKWLPLPGA